MQKKTEILQARENWTDSLLQEVCMQIKYWEDCSCWDYRFQDLWLCIWKKWIKFSSHFRRIEPGTLGLDLIWNIEEERKKRFILGGSNPILLASLNNILRLVVMISGSQLGGPSLVPFLFFSYDSYLTKSTKKEILVLFC